MGRAGEIKSAGKPGGLHQQIVVTGAKLGRRMCLAKAMGDSGQ